MTKSFDYYKDDICHGCKYAIKKPEGRLFMFDRRYGCNCIKRLQDAINKLRNEVGSINDLDTVKEHIEETTYILNNVGNYSSIIKSMLIEFEVDGYFEPQEYGICEYKEKENG